MASQNIPFEDNSFDAVFAIEATVHAPSLSAVYSEIHRVLKPGGTFGVYEWVLSDTFSETSPQHSAIRLAIERGNGIPSLQTKTAARQAMETAGFTLLSAEDLAERPDSLKWYYPLSGDLKSARSVKDWALVVRNTEYGRVAVKCLIRVLEFVRVAPKGTLRITNELITACDGLVAGGKQGLFTPMYLMVGKKEV